MGCGASAAKYQGEYASEGGLPSSALRRGLLISNAGVTVDEESGEPLTQKCLPISLSMAAKDAGVRLPLKDCIELLDAVHDLPLSLGPLEEEDWAIDARSEMRGLCASYGFAVEVWSVVERFQGFEVC